MLACISGCGGVIGCIVAAGGVLCAKKFALLGLMVGVSAKKFARRTKNGRKSGQVLWSGVIVLCPSEWVMR